MLNYKIGAAKQVRFGAKFSCGFETLSNEMLQQTYNIIRHLQRTNKCLSRSGYVCKYRNRMPKLKLGTISSRLY
jgi:hypothetical protein